MEQVDSDSEEVAWQIYENQCVVCGKWFRSERVITADVSKIDKLVSICKIRNDNCAKRILSNITKIYQGDVIVKYHKTCRANYRDNQLDITSDVKVSEASGCIDRTTRSVVQKFNWNADCFICGKTCESFKYKTTSSAVRHQASRTWSLVTEESDIQSENMFSRVMRVAEERNDKSLLLRLRSLPTGDLSSVKARYHRKWECRKYFTTSSDENENYTPTIPSQISYNDIAERVKKDIETGIFERGQILTMPFIRERFRKLAEENNFEISETYLRKHLQNLLKSVMPGLKFISKAGKATLVCSDEVSVNETLRNIYELSNKYDFIAENSETMANSTNETEETILHRAAHILKTRSNARVARMEDEYFSPKEMSVKAQEEFVDPLLYQFVQLLGEDETHIEDRNICDEVAMKHCLSISCDLTTLMTNVSSPKHLGLAIHFHNECGSKHIIDDLSNLGHCISYDEVRRFLTSAALHTIKGQQKTRSGGLVPKEILKYSDGGGLIVGAGDNWDHNERTVDGKRTTHAMTSIMIGDSPTDVSLAKLPRTNAKTLKIPQVDGARLHNITFYKKPHTRPEPILNLMDPFVRPNELVVESTTTLKIAKMRERLYSIERCADLFCEDVSVGNVVPPWSIYQSQFEDRMNVTGSEIVFNPILMSQPTDYSTVYTTLLRMKEVMNAMGQEHVPVIFDMGLLTKALEITWARPVTLSGVIPCEGGMHLLMCFFAAVGKLYGDSGLRNILSESGAYAAGTVEMILKGKDFDRAMFAYKVVDEVLSRKYLAQFLNWCRTEDKDIPSELIDALQKEVDNAGEEKRISKEDMLLELYERLEPLLEEFSAHGSKKSPTFRYWEQFLHGVLLPFKLFVASTRLGNWDVHQSSKKYMLPLLFAADRSNYAKYMTVQLLLMERLPEAVLSEFRKGRFAAKIATGIGNSTWIDYILEATQNKALKGSGGIIGLTLRGQALLRWFLARPISSKYSMEFHNSIASKDDDTGKTLKHHADTPAKIKQYNDMCSKISTALEKSFIDPFDCTKHTERLINIATGVQATPHIQHSLLNALETGKKAMEKFVDERLVTKPDGSSTPKSFYNSLPRVNVQTMAEMKRKVKIKARDIPIDADVMYQRLLAINSYKKVPAERVFSFENTPVPLSLYEENGKMYKGGEKKSDYLHKLESLLDHTIYSIDSADCVIFDGMAVVQALKTPKLPVTFLDMAVTFFNCILQKTRAIMGVKEIYVVFDKYYKNSIKNWTRHERGDNLVSKNVLVQSNILIPEDWNEFLSFGQQKSHLCDFYIEYFKTEGHSLLVNDETMVLSGGSKDISVKVTTDEIENVADLYSNQEEADTRILFHTKYAMERGNTVIIVDSPDTDVFVLLSHHYPTFRPSQIFFHTGHSGVHTDPSRYIPIHSIFDKLATEQRNILLPIYCITGCDTCSYIRGKGKLTAFRILINDCTEHQGLTEFGNSVEITKEQRQACIKFVGTLYGKRECLSLNALRCEKAKTSTKPRNLPPTDNSFTQHMLRCCYQLLIWRNALTPIHEFPPVSHFGYQIEDNGESLEHILSTQPMAAPELLNDMLCDCDQVCDDECPCFQNKQPCTSVCVCLGDSGDTDKGICVNIYTLTSLINMDSDSDNE